jgi:hypothetical protein
MFSSPSRGTPRRKLGGVASSIRSGTPAGHTSTPTQARQSISRRRGESILTNEVTLEGSNRDATTHEVRRDKAARSDVQEGFVLSRDDMHAIAVFCRLPAEVLATLQKMGENLQI